MPQPDSNSAERRGQDPVKTPSGRSKTMAYWIYQPWKWLVFIPLALLSTVLIFVLIIMVIPVFGALWVNRHLPPLWARLLVWMTPAHCRTEGLEHIQGRRAFVVVVNHQSQYDILFLYGWLPVDFKWVLKQELSGMPFIGWGCRALGHIFVNRSKPELARQAINRAAAKLEAGQGVLFFPEGTRNTGEALLPFKKGAFRLAVDRGLPILPVSIVGSQKILPTKTLDLRPGLVRLVVHKPIETNGLELSDMQALMRTTREVIEQPLTGAISAAETNIGTTP